MNYGVTIQGGARPWQIFQQRDGSADVTVYGEDEEGLVPVRSYSQEACRIVMTLERPLKGRAVLHGAWRMNPGPVIPWDCMRMPMLSFYGLEISENEVE